MPTFEIKAPNGKTYRVEGPEGSTAQQALERVQKQLSAAPAPAAATGSAALPQTPGRSPLEVEGDPGPDGRYPAGVTRRTNTPEDIANAARLRDEDTALPQSTFLPAKLLGAVEPFATLGSGIASTIVGNLYGIGKSAAQGKYGTEEGVRDAKKTADEYAARNTYQPRTDSGKSGVAGIAALAKPLEGLMGVAPVNGAMLTGAARAGVSNIRTLARANAAALGAEEAAQVAGNTGRLIDLVRKPKESTLDGVGAARSPIATQRVATADQLPVPMGGLMTKGMRSREKPQIAQEHIWAKDPELGAGLRNRTVEINQAALNNFDAFAEATGGQSVGLRPTGKVVDEYLIKRVEGAKQEIRKAYNDAAESAEGKTPADTGPLREYLKKHAAEADGPQGVPALKLARSLLDEFDPQGTGKIPLKEFNEIRERVGKISPEGSISSAYRKPLQDLVDTGVEANAGPLYRSARRSYENYLNEFKTAGAIDRLLRMKPGTKDRATALEDIVTKSTLDAPSTDAVRQVKTTLTRKQDAEGLQAWKDMQGEAARQIKERVTKASALGEDGAREVSPAALDKIIRELDADDRLNVIFSKQGAQQWRDLRDTVLDMKTVPVGTVSSSGTAEVLAGLLDTTVSAFAGAPLPIASGANFLIKRSRKKAKVKKIGEALNPDGSD